VVRAQNYIKWVELNPNNMGVVQPMVTAQKINLKTAKAMVEH